MNPSDREGVGEGRLRQLAEKIQPLMHLPRNLAKKVALAANWRWIKTKEHGTHSVMAQRVTAKHGAVMVGHAKRRPRLWQVRDMGGNILGQGHSVRAALRAAIRHP